MHEYPAQPACSSATSHDAQLTHFPLTTEFRPTKKEMTVHSPANHTAMKRHSILSLLALAFAFSVPCLNAAEEPSATAPSNKVNSLMLNAVTPALTNLPAAFAAPADEPYQLKDQAFHTSTLFTTKSITRDGMGACEPKVYKGNAYAIYMRQGDERVMVAKVPLNGSAMVTLPLVTVKDTTPKHNKGYTASSDNHTVYIIAVDRSGYIHVCGGMHSSPIVYWRSDRPEDISSFTRIMPDDKRPPATQPCPIAGSITFPKFFSDRHGQWFWTCVQGCGPLCAYDETKKLWTALGNPLGTIGKSKRRSDEISFNYTDKTSHSTTDTTVVKGGLSQKRFSVAWDSHSRMHMVFGLLNRHTYIGDRGSAHTILYAYSDDGGKMVFKSNGERIQLPILSDAGSNQGEVILSEGDSEAQIAVDKADRPMIWCHSQTGNHCFRLESGRWVDYPTAPVGIGGVFSTDPSGVVICNHHHKQDKEVFTRFWNPDGRNSEVLDLPVKGYDREYYRDTGELVWTSLSGNNTSATYTIHRTVFDRVSQMSDHH